MGSRRKLRALVVLGLCCLTAGCNRNGGGVLGGGASATGEKADQDTQKPAPQQKKKSGQQDSDFTEPQNAVDGKPSPASDSGSASAVAHHSVAQPGAPQGTVPGESVAPPPAKATSPQH